MSDKLQYLKHARTAGIVAVAAIATPIIGDFEGYSGKVYYDIGGIPTQCFGDTKHIDFKRIKSRKECELLLEEEVRKYAEQVDVLIEVPVKPEVKAAFTSMGYNIGLSALSKSTALKKLNQGDTKGACDAMLNWSYVGKMWIKGLHNRRMAERALCMRGV